MLDFIVSKKVIDERKVYRIHHIIEDQLVGLEAVEKMPDGKLRKIMNWNDRGELEDYMNDLEDIKEVDSKEKKHIVDFLERFPLIGKEELEKAMKKNENPMTVVHFLSTPAAYYTLLEQEGRNDEQDGAFYHAYEVELNREGHFRGILPIQTNEDLEVVLGHLINILEDRERVFFQFNAVTSVGIKRIGEEVSFLFIESTTTEDGQEQLATSLERVHTVRHVKESGIVEQGHRELTEDEKESFIKEMLSVLTDSSPSEIIKQ